VEELTQVKTGVMAVRIGDIVLRTGATALNRINHGELTEGNLSLSQKMPWFAMLVNPLWPELR